MHLPMNTANDVTPQDQSPQDETSGSPVDQMIARVKAYISNPKMVTPQTLTELLTELEDLKTVLDNEEAQEPAAPSGMEASMAKMTSMRSGQ